MSSATPCNLSVCMFPCVCTCLCVFLSPSLSLSLSLFWFLALSVLLSVCVCVYVCVPTQLSLDLLWYAHDGSSSAPLLAFVGPPRRVQGLERRAWGSKHTHTHTHTHTATHTHTSFTAQSISEICCWLTIGVYLLGRRTGPRGRVNMRRSLRREV